MNHVETPHWSREEYREAQALYREMQKKIAVLQRLNAQVYQRIRLARAAHATTNEVRQALHLAQRSQCA